MCGKYQVSTEDENLLFREMIASHYQADPLPPLMTIRPTDPAPVLLKSGARLMRFGIKINQKSPLILNTRSESLETSPLFGPRFEMARCLVPARFFYEWDAHKSAYLFGRKDEKNLRLAGLWFETMPLPAFVVITTAALEPVKSVHPRMPLILPSPEYQSAWLSSSSLARELLHMEADCALQIRRESA